jgi:tetratricopeptide (TPR) repeat protein
MSLIEVKAMKCGACGAAVQPDQQRCQFCGSPVEHPEPAHQPEAAPVLDGQEQIVDYYAVLGVTYDPNDPPGEMEIREGALNAEQRVMMNSYIDPEQRKKLVEEIEIGGWILTDSRARPAYDGLLASLRTGRFNPKHLDMLSDLQQQARRELGLYTDVTPGEDMLRQGIGYQQLGMYREAAQALRQAVEAMPDSVEANYRYGQALLGDGKGMSKTVHELRQAAKSFHAAAKLDPSLHDAPAYEALCLGLMAREEGDPTRAETELRRAVGLKSDLGVAWRALAALAFQAGKRRHNDVLDFCRRALLKDPGDEQAYLLLAASCWRAGQRDYARDAAGRIARLRGAGWNAERVLKEVVY